MKMISVIIVSYNTAPLLRRCLQNLFNYREKIDMEVFVVDNNSHDNSAAMVKREFSEVILIENDKNLGFAAANNQAWKLSSGDYILLLNPDAFVTRGAVRSAVEFMELTPNSGICGGSLEKPDGNPDPSARKFPTYINKFFTLSGLQSRFPHSRLFAGHEFGHADRSQVMEVDWIPGTFALYRQKMLIKTNLFDERFYIYYEETDLCRTCHIHGWKVYFLPSARVIHVGGASSQTREEKHFDQKALQVTSFRMRSEWLYHRKTNGLLAVICNAGVEAGWHTLRWFVNLLPGRSEGASKRQSSLSVIREVARSLKETSWGLHSPPTPW